MIEFNWVIKTLTPKLVNGRAGVATQVYFDLIATNTENGKSQILQGSFSPPAPEDDAEFVLYENLTREMVIGWLEGMAAVDNYKEQVAAGLEEQEPEAPLPWVDA